MEGRTLEKRLKNALSDCMSLLRKENRSCISGEEIDNEYDRMKSVEDKDREREDGDCEGEDRGRKG